MRSSQRNRASGQEAPRDAGGSPLRWRNALSPSEARAQALLAGIAQRADAADVLIAELRRLVEHGT